MRTLRELAQSKNEKIRLQAVLRMSDILLAHLQSEERAAIAIERAAARKAEAGVTPQPAAPTTAETTEEFLRRIRAESREESNDDE